MLIIPAIIVIIQAEPELLITLIAKTNIIFLHTSYCSKYFVYTEPFNSQNNYEILQWLLIPATHSCDRYHRLKSWSSTILPSLQISAASLGGHRPPSLLTNRLTFRDSYYSVRSNNSLHWLTELKKALYLL